MHPHGPAAGCIGYRRTFYNRLVQGWGNCCRPPAVASVHLLLQRCHPAELLHRHCRPASQRSQAWTLLELTLHQLVHGGHNLRLRRREGVQHRRIHLHGKPLSAA